MKIRTPNVKTMLDAQRMFENIKGELKTFEEQVFDGKIKTVPDYAIFSFTGNPYTTDLSDGARIPNDYVIDAGEGGITNNDDYTYTLNENRLYELNASVVCRYDATNSICNYVWYNEKTKKTTGTTPYSRPATYTGHLSLSNDAIGFIRTTEKQKISLIISSSSNLTGLYGASGAYAYMIIKEIARF